MSKKIVDLVSEEMAGLNREELATWFAGDGELSQESQKKVANLEEKFQTAISLVTLKNLERVLNLQTALITLEQEVYAPTSLAAIPTEGKQEAIMDINKTVLATLEYCRKLAFQQKGMFDKDRERVDSLAQVLKALPKDKLIEIQEKLEKGEI